MLHYVDSGLSKLRILLLLIITVGSVVCRLRRQEVYSGRLGVRTSCQARVEICMKSNKININLFKPVWASDARLLLNQVVCLQAGVHLVSLSRRHSYICLPSEVLIRNYSCKMMS